MYDLTEKIKLADLVPESVVDGKGIRMTVFVQGCRHCCPGCQNPTTWDEKGGKEYPISFITDMAARDPLLDGFTFSGGEPFLQSKPLGYLAEWAHEHKMNVWCYSGYTFEQLTEMSKTDEHVSKLFGEIDVLVDGPFVESKKDLKLAFRGSSNQRIIDMQKTRERGEIVLLME